jgi:antitoxin ParD1/3/4
VSKISTDALGNHFATFVERQVKTGRYESEADVLRAGLRLLEEHEMKVERLRAALIEGEESGPATPFNFDEFIAGKRRDAAVKG